MGTRGYVYHQIRVRIHIIIGSQISIYYTRIYPFSYLPHAREGFYQRVPVGMCIFATPSCGISKTTTNPLKMWWLEIHEFDP